MSHKLKSAYVLGVDSLRGITDIAPKNGSDFQLEELQKIVGGYIELIHLPDGTLLVINEEGKLHGLPVNELATRIAQAGRAIAYSDEIVGPAVRINSDQLR